MEIKGIKVGKEEIKLYLQMISSGIQKILKNTLKKLLELIEFSKFAGYKINIQNLQISVVVKTYKNEIKKAIPIPFVITSKNKTEIQKKQKIYTFKKVQNIVGRNFRRS